MKLLLHHPHHLDHHPGKPPHHRHHKDNKKSRKIMKKMAKLEKKLSKYHFDSSSSDDSCPSDTGDFRSRSLSRSHKRRKGRSHHRRHGRRFASRGRSSSSSSSSSSSDSAGSSSSSSSSRSPSPCERRFHGRQQQGRHHGPPGHLSRSKSFAGRPHRSPSPFSRGPHHHRHHPHGPPHHRGRFWHHQCRRFQDGLRGYFAMLSTETGTEARETAGAPTAADQPDLMDLGSPSRSISRERVAEVPSAPAEEDGDVQVIEQDAAEQESVAGPEINETLAENWTKVAREGLPSEAKSALLKKYSVSKNCTVLRGPKLNKEILPAATESGVKYDTVQMQQQNQLGAGLTALGKAITDLNNKTELKEDQGVVGILEELNEAAVIIVDTHRNMSKVRQSLMQSELNKRVRPVVDNCEHDEFLYGKDFSKKIENVKGFGKYKRGNKKHEREGRYGKGEKRKQHDQDGGRRCKHSNFAAPHGGPKIH